MGGAHLGGEMLASKLRCDRRPIAVAIGRFRNDVVEAGRRFGIRLQQLGVGADIAGGQHPQRLAAGAFAGKLELDRGRAEQMTGVPIARAHAGHGLEPGLVVDRAKGIERGDRVGLRVDRRDLGASARRIAPVEHGNFGFLDAAGVGQHVGAQIDGAARRHDAAAEALRAPASAAGRCDRYARASAAPCRCRPDGTERRCS